MSQSAASETDANKIWQVLESRAQALASQLARVRLDVQNERIDASLRRRVAVPFENQIFDKQTSLEGIHRDIADRLNSAASWAALEQLHRECRPLFAECLAFIHGGLARAGNVDKGLCAVADAMIWRLSGSLDTRWNRFTLLADQEYFGPMADIVRLRFPEVSIWNLPVAVHEFGHFVGPEIRSVKNREIYPFAQLLKREKDPSKARQHLHEQFADLFATFATGPAYAMTCLRLRFSATQSSVDSQTHPSPNHRAYLILRALRKLDALDASRPYYGLTEELENLWRSTVEMAGGSAELKDEDAAALDLRFSELFDILLQNTQGARYNGWSRALTLAAAIVKHVADGAALGPLDEARSIPDVLNAAWLARAHLGPERADAIGEAAMNLCREVERRDAPALGAIYGA